MYLVSVTLVHHYGMICPRIVDGEDGLQMWRVR